MIYHLLIRQLSFITSLRLLKNEGSSLGMALQRQICHLRARNLYQSRQGCLKSFFFHLRVRYPLLLVVIDQEIKKVQLLIALRPITFLYIDWFSYSRLFWLLRLYPPLIAALMFTLRMFDFFIQFPTKLFEVLVGWLPIAELLTLLFFEVVVKTFIHIDNFQCSMHVVSFPTTVSLVLGIISWVLKDSDAMFSIGSLAEITATLVGRLIGVGVGFKEFDWLVPMSGFLWHWDFDQALECPFVEEFFNRKGLVFCMSGHWLILYVKWMHRRLKLFLSITLFHPIMLLYNKTYLCIQFIQIFLNAKGK